MHRTKGINWRTMVRKRASMKVLEGCRKKVELGCGEGGKAQKEVKEVEKDGGKESMDDERRLN